MMVDDIKRNLEVSFNQNPSFKAENLSRDNTVEDKTNTVVCIAILVVNKLTIIAINAPIPNQNTKKPIVAISITKNIPARIIQNCHIIFTSIK